MERERDCSLHGSPLAKEASLWDLISRCITCNPFSTSERERVSSSFFWVNECWLRRFWNFYRQLDGHALKLNERIYSVYASTEKMFAKLEWMSVFFLSIFKKYSKILILKIPATRKLRVSISVFTYEVIWYMNFCNWFSFKRIGYKVD